MKPKTKILATIGPASFDESVLLKMAEAGMDAARINFSHGTHPQHAETIKKIRCVEAKVGRPIAIHADLGGPKIRTGKFTGGLPIELKKGAVVRFAPEDTAKPGDIPFTFPQLAKDLKRGGILLLDDGLISLAVKAVEGSSFTAQVIDGGVLREHKGINLPNVVLSASAVTEKDVNDLKFALAKGVNSVGVSFVQSAADIVKVRKLMATAGKRILIIAKIERRAALGNIENIMKEADAVMVARGDLGVETPLEEVPIIQKRCIELGFRMRRPVIVATQMLESMVREARPTRAEVSDVANSVFDGADVVMLSAETSIGIDPANAVRAMRSIVMASEKSLYAHREPYEMDIHDDSPRTAATRAACFAADEANARLIAVFTMTGRSALLVSKQRPRAPIIAVTHNQETARRCSLYFGVTPVVVRKWRSIDTMVENGVAEMLSKKLLEKGDKLVIVCGDAPVAGATNIVKIHTAL